MWDKFVSENVEKLSKICELFISILIFKDIIESFSICEKQVGLTDLFNIFKSGMGEGQ
jgi:hypothetical protein